MNTDFTDFRKEFYALVEASQHIVITAHYSPDDDSIGSVLSVYTILTTQYPEKDIRIIYTGEKVERYAVFKNFEKIEFVPDNAAEVGHADLLIVLDVSQYARSARNPELLQKVPKQIVIDHHASKPDQFTLSLIQPNISSNCELVYRALDAGSMLTEDLAEYFLLGIVGDTGNFSHINKDQAGVFDIAKELVQKISMPIDAFRARYSGIPKRIIPLLQELVKNTTYISVEGWPEMQYSHVDRSVIAEGKYDDEDMSAASHIYMGQYLPRIQGDNWGVVLTPRSDGGVRMSGRSLKGSVNVRDMFERMGLGGGHDRASGANFKKETVDREPKQCIVEVLSWMEHNAPLIG